MKKLTFIIFGILAVSFFFTSCSDPESPALEKKYSGTEMYLNSPDKELYEKAWEYISQQAHTVVVTKGDNLWDIAQECGNNPWAWEEIYYMNLPELSGRLEYRDFPNGEQRPWVWIYPGEILNVPTYFSNCAGLQIQGSQKVDYYYPTALSVRVVEPSPGLNSQKILVLDEGYRSSPKQAEQKGYGDSTLPAWFWNIGKWLLALGLLLAVILILFWMLSQLWEAISNSSGNQTPSAAPAAPDNNIEGRQCVTESQTDDIAIIGALTKHLEQLQMTGGKSNISVGENIHAEFEIPNPVEPEFTLLIVEIDNEKVENKKKK